MKISKETLSVLKNFASINASLLIPEGNTILTGPPAKNFRAKYVCQEEFPRTIAIYDLPEFLNGLTIFTEPDLDFSNDKYVLITETCKNIRMPRKVKYYYSNPALIDSPSNKDIVLIPENIIVDFVLDQDDIKTIFRSAGMYKLPDLSIMTEDGDICVVLRSKEDPSKPTMSITVGKVTNPNVDFQLNFRLDTLRILNDSYRVRVSNQHEKMTMAEFASETQDLTYFMVLEYDSYYKEN